MKKDSKEAVKMEEGKPQIIQINEGEVQAHVERLVKQTVEEMLNGMLDAEADRFMKKGSAYFLCAGCGQMISTKGTIPGPALDRPLGAKSQIIKRCIESGLMLCDDCFQVMVMTLAEKGQCPGLEIVCH